MRRSWQTNGRIGVLAWLLALAIVLADHLCGGVGPALCPWEGEQTVAVEYDTPLNQYEQVAS